MTFKRYQNINRMLKASVERSPDTYAYCWFNESLDTRGCTWKEYECEVDQVSKSLLALGIKKDNKVSILANTCYQWVLSDMGIVSIGAVTVGIYQSNLARDCEYIINHSDSVLIFAEDQQQLEKLIYIRKDIPQLAKVILFKGQSNDDWVLSYEDFLALGNTVSDDELKVAQGNVESEDIASIVYTSGTTGLPKGAMLSHGNITFTTQSVLQSVDIHEGDSTILFLPLAHVFARTILYAGLYSTTTTFFNRSMDTLLEDLALSQPHWFASVPRIYEKVYGKVNSGAEEKGGLALKIFRWACGLGAEVSELNAAKKPLPLNLSLKYTIANKLVFTKLHAAFGGRLRWCISGAAPMNPSIAKFFDGAGIPILEGIGMTENTSFSNLNRIDNYRFGTVGLAGPGIEVKLADDGEFLVRGPNVMQGYYKMPEETAKDIDKDGWLATGDLASIDTDGFVTVTGRKKDLIITSGGKNIAPSAIEGLMALPKYINQVCVVGDQHKYLTALITLDQENITDYCHAHGIDSSDANSLLDNVQLYTLIETAVNIQNQELASWETIKKFTLVPEFTIEDETLTPTLKVKRNVVIKRYAGKIEHMYSA